MMIPGLRRVFDRNDRLLLWFAIVPIVFFSLSVSKLPGYILPSVPPIVMLCARAISNVSSRAFRIAVYIEAGMMLFIGVAFGFFGEMLNVDPHIGGMMITFITFGMALALTIIATWMKPLVLLAFNAMAMSLIVLVATNFVLPRFEITDTMRPLQSVLRSIAPADETAFLYKPARWTEYGMQFYRFNKVKGVWSPKELESVLEKHLKALFISDDKGLLELGEIPGVEIKIETTVGNHSVFWVQRSL
jgi:4-amino-4-deoxy-L-arabinose transferase-like glycosyltransferase